MGNLSENPFSELVENELRMTCVNLGCMNAGIDAFVHDPELLQLASRAEITVIQVMGAQNMSNRFYRVHPRRNDRFLTASTMMKSVFRDVDFTEYHFTRHMLCDVANRAEDRFSFVRSELRTAWSSRMKTVADGTAGAQAVALVCRSQTPKRGAVAAGARSLVCGQGHDRAVAPIGRWRG